MNYRGAKKYRLPTARFRELYYFSMQYWDFKRELEEISLIGSPSLDGMPHGGTVGSPTERIAIQTADLISAIKMIEECAKEADPSISQAILKAVTTQGATYPWLKGRGYLACERDKYYYARSKYYWLLDKRRT